MTKFENFTVHALAPSGIEILSSASTFSATSIHLARGQALEITEALYSYSRDRNGDSWLDLTEEQQVAQRGAAWFGRGPAPEHVLAEVAADRRARDLEEIQFLRAANPRTRRASDAAARLAVLEERVHD